MFFLQMNASNQSSSSLKQVKIQIPMMALNSLENSLNELSMMYPIAGKKLDMENISED